MSDTPIRRSARLQVKNASVIYTKTHPRWYQKPQGERRAHDLRVSKLMEQCASLRLTMDTNDDAMVMFCYTLGPLLHAVANPLTEFGTIDHSALYHYMSYYREEVKENRMRDDFIHDWKVCASLLSEVGYHF